MEIEYIGELLQDGHLSVAPAVKSKLKKGDKLKIKIDLLSTNKNKKTEKLDPATLRILKRINNAKPIGAPDDPRSLSHSKLAEERIDEKFPCTE